MPVALAFTIREPAGGRRTYRIDRSELILGRGEGNDLVLGDPTVSRRQARVELNDGRVSIENLSERSPLYLNGARRDAATLRPGDVLRFGDTELLLDVWTGEEPATERRPAGNPGYEESDATTQIVERVERARLELLSEMVEVIPRREEPRVYLERTLSSLFRIMDLGRAFVAMVDPRSGGFRQVATLNREAGGGPVRVSRTILNRVIRSGEGLLAGNAMADPDLADSDSVYGEGIQSVLCVPIHRADVVVGALYADNRAQPRSFTRDDLAFLTLIARILSFQMENLELTARLTEENVRLRKIIEGNDEVVAVGTAMRKLLLKAQKAASTDENVLITGETGSGKSLLARTIHRLSPRSSEPFVEMSCAAIPATLLEAELFGYGSQSGISGADPRGHAGYFEAAGKGSILLDEIGDMDRSLQAKILHAIENGRFRRLGSTELTDVRCRILAATNQDLETAVEEGAFRKDLYYRIRVVPLHVPPLREHPEDIVPIARHLLGNISPGHRIGLGRKARQVLIEYHWPGNVRELRNVLARALAMGDSNKVAAADLKDILQMSPEEEGRGILSLEEVQRRHMQYVLDLCGGNKVQTARALGISRSKLYDWLRPSPPAP